MTDPSTPAPPPLPERRAADVAASADAAATTTGAEAGGQAGPTPGIAGVDDTGVRRLTGDIDDIGRGFLAALFDITFTRFITRRLASVFFLVGLIAIGIAFVSAFVGGIIHGIGALGWNPGGGIALILSTVIVVPVLAFFAVVLLRFVIESGVALVAIAENTERTAENTRRGGA
ncbi:DUF4282 domain-containing protein [Microbacterium flavum]|uniref:DUF4282 domain-containing protein n=1 Tax=Microbacterium flavum TaxID=415216 RepID=A0ABS5XVZ5_9MICO|nr:DUF4282 domain-containing protein [Microbacterium flavum]MBT8798700.1 DUF4282 domain-containing protein [Microbacterium flavum]